MMINTNGQWVSAAMNGGDGDVNKGWLVGLV